MALINRLGQYPQIRSETVYDYLEFNPPDIRRKYIFIFKLKARSSINLS